MRFTNLFGEQKMNLHDFSFDLPEELIAQEPLKERTHSRLLIVDRLNNTIEHKQFYEIIDELKEGDCLVLNNTRVIPARLMGAKKTTLGKVEFLLLNRRDDEQWEVMVKPGKRAKVGDEIVFSNRLTAVVVEVVAGGNRIVRFQYQGIFETLLDQLGEMPLPPYIHHKLEDTERYQTVYSKHRGSAAAPTAGLHFTHELLDRIKAKGVQIANVTLHVGLGTFRPVKVDNILEHQMHSEYYSIDESQAEIINTAKSAGHRIISVGTTSTRTLEANADENGFIHSGQGYTDIFIYPGYQFKIVDALITNFHLPESTLMMLVSAFSNRETILHAYEEAILQRYRFFSFGDAMFIR